MENVPLHPHKDPYIKIEDAKFAEDLAQEFMLPLDDLKELIEDTRNAIQNGYPHFIFGSNDGIPEDVVAPWHRLMKYDLKVKKISVETDKGIIEFFPEDRYFRPLMAQLRKIKKRVKLALSKYRKVTDRFERNAILFDILKFFVKQDFLNKTTALYATGLCMIYFELYGYKPILKKEDFTDDYEAWDYKHYLVDIVKSRLKNAIETLYFEYPAGEEPKEIEDMQVIKEWLASLGFTYIDYPKSLK